MECYLAITKNEIMPFAVTWMDLEIIILSEVSQTERQISYDIIYTWNLKYDPNELIYKIEIDLQTEKINFWLPKGKVEVGKGRIGSLGLADANYYI